MEVIIVRGHSVLIVMKPPQIDHMGFKSGQNHIYLFIYLFFTIIFFVKMRYSWKKMSHFALLSAKKGKFIQDIMYCVNICCVYA